MKIIYKVEVPECSHLTFGLGENEVQFIKERNIQISSCAETQSSSNKLVYEVHFFDGRTIEISADLKGLVVYKIDESKLSKCKKMLRKKEEFNFKMMMRQDNFEVLTKCAPKASHRLIEIIAEGYNADFPDDAALEEWFGKIEKQESGKFPTRWRLQVIGSLNHVKMLLKSHYKYRYEAYKKFYVKK